MTTCNPISTFEAWQPTIVDLFAGAGGTGLGFTRAGFRILGAVEMDANAARTYQNNLYTNVKQVDILKLSPVTFRKELGLRRKQLDVLVGCPPCQGFSRMRNKNGAQDEKNKLVLTYLRFVKAFLPRFALFENVPGIIHSKHGRVFFRLLFSGLKKLGYKIVSREVDAADYGVPQRRKRIIVIAGRYVSTVPFPVPTHGKPNTLEVRNGARLPWLTVRDAIGNGRYPELISGQDGTRDNIYPNHIAPSTGSDVIKFIKMVPKDGGSRVQVPKEFWLPCHLNYKGHRDVYGRLSWDKVANTITAGCTNPSKGRFVHPDQDRALSAREAAALQGFPDCFILHGKNFATQIGNAVPPPLAEAIAHSLKEWLLRRQMHQLQTELCL